MPVLPHDAEAVRAEDWLDRLAALFRERMQSPFVWGEHDCCLFAADAVLAQTGIDHAATLRGTYSTASEAMRVVLDNGGIEAIAGRAGPQIAPLFARLGDIGLVGVEGRQSLAVCTGLLWLAPSEAGLAALPMSSAMVAWRVE